MKVKSITVTMKLLVLLCAFAACEYISEDSLFRLIIYVTKLSNIFFFATLFVVISVPDRL